MHELSLALSLVRQVEELAKTYNARKIAGINVLLGKLSGVERESFEFCFPIACEGSIAEGAVLHVQEIPVSVKCKSCGRESEAEVSYLSCSACSSMDVKIIGGKEFLIDSMEID